VRGNYAIGDPGLLADELIKPQEKKYNLGIVPHWTDRTLEKNPLFTQFKPKIIRVSDDPIKVIEEIAQCRKIVSSSLHGIILADALNIPRRFEVAPRILSHPHQEGGLFKFHDYASSIGMKLEIGKLQQANYNNITEKQHQLFDVLEEIKSLFTQATYHQAS
jgi:hypothetical protein